MGFNAIDYIPEGYRNLEREIGQPRGVTSPHEFVTVSPSPEVARSVLLQYGELYNSPARD